MKITKLRGQFVESWFDRQTRSWITSRKDSDRNQIVEAKYSGTKQGMLLDHKWEVEDMIAAVGRATSKIPDPENVAKGRALCPKCHSTGVGFASHAHAFGFKDYKKAACRYCGAQFTIAESTTTDTRVRRRPQP